MPEHEDSISGSTDVSGTPPPVRQPQHVAADQNRQVKARSRPMPGGDSKPQGPSPLESAAKGAGRAGEQALDTAYQQRPFQDTGAQMFGDWNPVDWGKQVANDSSMVWSLGRQGYQAWSAFTDPNKVHQSISVAFQGHDARSRALQTGLIGAGFLASAFPAVQLDVAGQDLSQGAAGQRVSPLEDTKTALANAPREMTNPVNYLGGEGTAGVVAMASVPILQSFLAANPDEQKTAFIWAGIAGALFGIGHLGALRPVLERLLGDRAPQILQALESSQAARQAADEAAVDPQKQGQAAMEHLDKALAVGGTKPYSKVVAKAAKAGEKVVQAQVGEHGEIKLLTADEQKRLQKGLQKIGVTDVEGLIAKAQQEGGLGGKAMKWVVKNWKALGMPYDLVAKMAGEAPLHDPRAHLEQIADEDLHGRVANHLTRLNHYLAEIGTGIFTSAHDPAAATLRSLAGETRNLDRVHAHWMVSMKDALGEWGEQEQNGVQMMKAAEGDLAAYEALPSEAKAVVDGFGLVRAWLREQSQNTRYAKNFVPNWVPRLDTVKMVQGRGRPTTGTVLAREARKQRALALSADPGSDHLTQVLRYPTVQDTNEAMARSREDLQAQVLGTDRELRADLANDPEILEIRELASGGQYEEAKKRLAQVAFDRFPSKDENFLRAVNATGYQARSILAERAIQELLQTKVQGKHLRSGVDIATHALVQPENNRQREEFINQGYVRLADSKFGHVLAEPGFAKLLDRYLSLSKQAGGAGLRDVQVAKQLLATEKAMVKIIMYSPAIHGINMLGRLGMAATLHPIDFLGYLMHGERFAQGADDTREALQSEAYASGVLPNYKKGQWADWAIGSMHNALGDIEESMPEMQMTSKKGLLSSLIPKPLREHNPNEWFWGKVNDFGVMMYHLEKADAKHGGLSEVQARLWAARRANSWMGAVAPEDTNPMIHDASRMLMFAPNWWRTWGELMVPIYRRSGIFGGDEHAIQFAAKQAAKTAMAAYLFQHMSGNALNYALSGHLQYQNQPGQQDRIQISRPAIIHMLQASGIVSSDPNSSQYIDPETGVNPRTGAVLTMENPFARQQYATEMAAGYESGQSGKGIGPQVGPVQVSLPPSGADTWDGLTNFAASRTSPFLNAAAAAANVDLYGTLTSGQARSVVQGQPTGQPSWLSLVMAMLNTVPGMQQFFTDVQRTQDPSHPQSNVSVLGTQVPSGVSDYVHAFQDVGARTAISAVTGINSPTAHAQRTPGQQLSDADYQRIQQVNQKYHDQMQAASAAALSGQMTPYQWRQAYSTMSKQHTAAMQALYKNAPEYVNGGDALASKWDQLYDQATLSDGSIDQGRLAQLQTEFLAKHTPQQRQQMNAILRSNDTRYPMLALYHHVLDGYNTWQEEWATQRGTDVTRLREEIAEYNSLYSHGVAAQRQYLGQHPELLAYRSAVKTQFDRTAMGLAYGLFYGQQAAIREAVARHETVPQLEQAVSQQVEQQPAAPVAA